MNRIKLFISNYRTLRQETSSRWFALKLSLKVLLKVKNNIDVK